MNVALVRFVRVNKVFPHFIRNLAQIDEAISDVDQLWCGVRSEPGNLNATSLVSDRVDRINEIFIARDKHGRVVTAGEREHIDRNLDIEICLARAIVKSLQLFLHDAKSIASHPKQKALL